MSQEEIRSFLKKRTKKLLLLGGCAIVLGGCPHPSPVERLYPTLSATLGPDWLLVPLPNASLGPGTVVEVTADGAADLAHAKQLGITRLGSLKSCSVADAAVLVTDSAIPTMTEGATYSIDASLGAKLASIAAADLGANASSTADFTITKSTDSTLDYIALSRWMNDSANASVVQQACHNIFNQTNVYVVQEAFIISAGTYTFKDSHGANISVTPPPNVPVKASIDGSNGNNGGLTIDSPIVFALKVLQPLPDGGFKLAGLASAAPHYRTAHHAAPAPPPPPPGPGPLYLGDKTLASVSGVSP
jgi:hypothetical protein